MKEKLEELEEQYRAKFDLSYAEVSPLNFREESINWWKVKIAENFIIFNSQ